jgi:hypothetical protein
MWIRLENARRLSLKALIALCGLFGTVVLVPFLQSAAASWGPLKDPARTIAGFSKSIAIILHDLWIVGPVFSGILLLAGFTLGLWSNEFLWTRENVTAPPPDAPDIGSLRYVIAGLTLHYHRATDEMAGQIEVEIANDSDRLIVFHAVTAGNINGIPFHEEKVEFEGYIPAKQSRHLVSKRIVGIPVKFPPSIHEPSVTGIYEYDLFYGYAGEKFTRRSSLGCKLDLWDLTLKEPGTKERHDIRVVTYNPIEE